MLWNQVEKTLERYGTVDESNLSFLPIELMTSQENLFHFVH